MHTHTHTRKWFYLHFIYYIAHGNVCEIVCDNVHVVYIVCRERDATDDDDMDDVDVEWGVCSLSFV